MVGGIVNPVGPSTSAGVVTVTTKDSAGKILDGPKASDPIPLSGITHEQLLSGSVYSTTIKSGGVNTDNLAGSSVTTSKTSFLTAILLQPGDGCLPAFDPRLPSVEYGAANGEEGCQPSNPSTSPGILGHCVAFNPHPPLGLACNTGWINSRPINNYY